jgi:hypothetical protein
MKPKYEIKVFNAGLVLILYIFIGMYSCTHAQGTQRVCETGYEVSYGLHNFKPRMVSDHITKVSPASRGISLGGYFGNNLLKIRTRGLGYYEANRVFDQKYYQFEAELLCNFSPLEFLRVSKNLMDIYVITGLNYTHINFDNNVSMSGKKAFHRLSSVAGIGLEYIIRQGSKTIYIFSDATVANHFGTPQAAKEKTPFPSIQSAVNFGVRMGYRKHVNLKRGF